MQRKEEKIEMITDDNLKLSGFTSNPRAMPAIL